MRRLEAGVVLGLFFLSAAAVPASAATGAPQCPDEASGKVRVVITGLGASDGLAQAARVLGQVVAEEAAKVEGYEVLSHEEVRALLDQEAQKALLGCDEQSCLAEIAGALDAELIITGQLEHNEGGAPMVTLSLVNSRALVTVNRVSMAWPGDASRLPDLARAATQALVFEKAQRAPARLVIHGLPASGSVLIDGKERTPVASPGVIDELEVGPHEVRFLADGYAPRTEHVLLLAGDELRLDASLEHLPVTSTWWFWAGAGAALVAGVGATAAVFAFTGPASVTATAQVPFPGLAGVEGVKGAR